MLDFSFIGTCKNDYFNSFFNKKKKNEINVCQSSLRGYKISNNNVHSGKKLFKNNIKESSHILCWTQISIINKNSFNPINKKINKMNHISKKKKKKYHQLQLHKVF